MAVGIAHLPLPKNLGIVRRSLLKAQTRRVGTGRGIFKACHAFASLHHNWVGTIVVEIERDAIASAILFETNAVGHARISHIGLTKSALTIRHGPPKTLHPLHKRRIVLDVAIRTRCKAEHQGKNQQYQIL